MESSSGCSVWFGHRHRGHPEDTSGGFSERGEDFYPAIREDIELATREDFFMAMDMDSIRRRQKVAGRGKQWSREENGPLWAGSHTQTALVSCRGRWR
jgi:hypothetical protein